ncbi:hypothetical protein ACFSFY_14465 [Sporosarcina siberiensis]|uniref:Uncharacterized protein n=1 Tax=Sporosarcina siberiensis TaxID=1365606 RepID=A0ABW4SIV6_9BACL
MESKLDELMDDETFAVDAISHDVGIMFTEHNYAVNYLILEYADRFDAYLNLYDEGEAPFRNILVKGSSKSKEIAMSIASRKLNNEYAKINR